jgi:hypothetical protein
LVCALGARFTGSVADNPVNILYTPFFPVGLVAMFPNGAYYGTVATMLVFPALLGWVLYGIIYFFIRRARRRGTFLLLYILLCVLLVLNLVGCQRVIEASKGIH